jgi:hypothetical protein
MDAASAAAMSDPWRNPLFQRRWRESQQAADPRPPDPPAVDQLELTGQALLEQWRRERAQSVEVAP